MSFIIGGTTGAIVGAAGIGALGSLGGAALSAHAAGQAADKQAAAAQQANELQHQMFEEQRGDQQPWRQAGAGALSQMQDPSFQHDFSMADFQADPGYQFRMQQGQQALERSAAARGGLNSGGTLKALTDYAQGAASQEYQNAYNRFTNNQTNRFNRLASLAGAGQTANAQVGAAGQNYANQAGANMTGLANAQGAAQMAGAKAWGNSLSSLGDMAGQGVNTWMQMQQMQKQNELMGKLFAGGAN